MKTILSRKQSGSTLIVVMSITATLMVIVGIAAEYTMGITRNVQRSNTLESAIATGDSCLDILFGNWRSICRQPGNVNLALPTNSFTSIPLPTSSLFPNISNFGASAVNYYGASPLANPPTISNFKVVATDAEWNALSSPAATPIPMLGQTGATTTAVYNYIASADITLPAVTSNVVARVRRIFQKQQISPWNFAIFYVDPLEIHPGPQLTITGWVHTNSSLYTGHNTLTFADKVTYGGDWFYPTAQNPTNGFMPGDRQHPETPTAPSWPSNLPPAQAQALQPFGMDSTQIFGGPPNPNTGDSYHELIEPPVAGYSDPLSDSRYWDKASVAIQVDASNNVTIGTPNSDGTITSLGPPASGPDNRTPAQKNLYNMFSGAITTNQTIQDNREGKNVRLVNLDIGKIENSATGNPTYKSSSFNGIVYIYDSSASSSVRRGVRLLNGSKIPLSGLTVASQNPVYVQGDFNTGGTPPSDSGDPSDATKPQVSGYTRAPTSILGDAVNILSNSWNDANSFSDTGSRSATNTTVNAAIVSGIVPTAPVGGDGSYSGGAENFPRFLEDWSAAKLTYYGSMVELYKSQQSIGEWGKANVYVPPTRQWYFDNNFKITPPPGGLMIYTYLKSRWYVL